MSPTEQIQKRLNDTASTNQNDRMFFEYKFREYKSIREKAINPKNNLPYSPMTIKTELRTIASLFGQTIGKLNLSRGDWETQTDNRILNRMELTKADIKSMYSHAGLRDKALLLILS